MLDFLFGLGYLGLFIVSILGATLLPLSTELFVLGMPTLGYNLFAVILIATLGGYVGSLINYFVGKKGGDFLFSRYITIKESRWNRAVAIYQKYGVIALFFSWLPIIGDPLLVVAGTFHFDLRKFSFWVILGKLFRYLLLLILADVVLDWVS